MTSVPPETSGVAGAMLQVCLQVGAVLGLSIQAGLLTIQPNNVLNEYNVQASYWFEMGWCFLNAILVLIFFKRGKAAPGSEMEKKKIEEEKTGTNDEEGEHSSSQGGSSVTAPARSTGRPAAAAVPAATADEAV